MNNFNTTVTFEYVVPGQEFIEVLTNCNEVARRIEPVRHKGKLVNAQRIGGKLISMADWEPVFIDQTRLWIYYLRLADVAFCDLLCDICGRDVPEIWVQTSYKRMFQITTGSPVWSAYWGVTRRGHKKCLENSRKE